MKKLNVVVVGAHVDDHWFGMGGTMLKAARNGHNVTVIQAVTTYCNWPVVTGREKEFKEATADLTRKTGIKVVGLGHDYQRMTTQPQLVTQISEKLVELEPDLLFCPWTEDINQDHIVIGRAACLAGTGAFSFLPPKHALMKLPRQILQYALDVNMLHKSFRPDAYTNIDQHLFDMLELNNVFDELYSKHPAWADSVHRTTVIEHQSHAAAAEVPDRKATLNSQSEYLYARAIIHGLQCGARYADAFASYQHAPADENLLAQL